MQVKSDWLDGAKDVQRYEFMATAVRLETMRILLPGYGCQMWYLGERVYHWHLGPSRRRIPFPILFSMLWSYSLTGPELRVALEGYDASTLLEHSCYYQQYIQENILEQVPIGAAEVYTPTSYSLFFSASCTDYHLQFEESLQLVLLLVTFLFWIDLCTTGLLLFRLLLSSTLISIRRSLLSFHHRKLLM